MECDAIFLKYISNKNEIVLLNMCYFEMNYPDQDIVYSVSFD